MIRQWIWWESGGFEFGLGQHIDGLAVVLLFLVSFISTAGADLLHRVRAGRPPLHALLRRHHAVLGRHAGDGPRREHGAADPRLGDHGPVLVPADRALVGGAGNSRAAAEGVPHRARRRRRAARRNGDAVLRRQPMGHRSWFERLQHPRHLRLGALRRRQRHGPAVGGDRVVHRLHRQVRPVPAAHLAPRRDGRPDARVVAAALARRWSWPACSSSPGCTPCSSRGSNILGSGRQPDRRHRRHHDPDRRRRWRSCRTTSSGSSPTPPSRSSAT